MVRRATARFRTMAHACEDNHIAARLSGLADSVAPGAVAQRSVFGPQQVVVALL